MSTKIKRDRLSVDMEPEEHKKIKVYAAMHGQTIKEYVLECIHQRMVKEPEAQYLNKLTSSINPAMKDVWNNDKDSVYDDA